MVTAKEIAEKVHISRSTVQRALSGDPKVSAAARKRILETARSMGYRPNRHARALVMRKQKVEYAAILTIPENIFMREVLKGINKAQEELKDSNVNVSIHFMDSIDGTRQAQLIDKLVLDSVRGVVLVAIDCLKVRRSIANGAKRGTSFVTLATDIPSSKRLCFVGQDNLRSGRVAGELMDLIMPRRAQIACFVGTSQFLGHKERLSGFRERYLVARGEEEIVEVLENFDSSKFSEKLTKELLEKHPDLQGIFIAGAGVDGVCRTVKALDRGKKIRVVSYDLVQSARYCREGLVDFIIDQAPFEEGYRALNLLNSYVMYGEVPKDKELMKIDIRIRDTLEG